MLCSHQSAEKAVKALHLHMSQEAWGTLLPGCWRIFRVMLQKISSKRHGSLTTSIFPLVIQMAIPKERLLNTMEDFKVMRP